MQIQYIGRLLNFVTPGNSTYLKNSDIYIAFRELHIEGLLYLMAAHFEALSIYKPAQSRPANSERYILCRGYRRGEHTDALVAHLISVNDRLNDMAHDWEKKPPALAVPSAIWLIGVSVRSATQPSAVANASNTAPGVVQAVGGAKGGGAGPAPSARPGAYQLSTP